MKKPSAKGRKLGSRRKPPTTSIRIYESSHSVLRELSDKTGDSIVDIVEKLTQHGKTRYGYIVQQKD